MCQGQPSGTPQNLHEKFCHATHGIPCKTVHAIGRFFNLIIGRMPKENSCQGPGSGQSCGCGHHADKP